MNTAYAHPGLVAEAAPEARAAFIRRTYTHLAMAILAFIGLEVIFFHSDRGHHYGPVVPRLDRHSLHHAQRLFVPGSDSLHHRLRRARRDRSRRGVRL